MKLIQLSVVLFLSVVALSTTGCTKKEGCTDMQADNYDSEAKDNVGCQYRYVTTIDISNVSVTNPSGDQWDIDGSGPDLKLNFGKNTSSGYDYSTNSVSNVFATSLTPNSNIQFTNETWKYQLVDEDLLSSDEVIASGTLNPISQGGNAIITITNGSISMTFHYKLQ